MYVGFCCYIGILIEIIMRRQVIDIEELIVNKRKGEGRGLCSGSFREGFCFKLFDKDYMIWNIRIKVIIDLFQCVIYDFFKYFILLVEDIDIFLGFVRLEFILFLCELFNLFVICRNVIRYILSLMYKNNFCSYMLRFNKIVLIYGLCL